LTASNCSCKHHVSSPQLQRTFVSSLLCGRIFTIPIFFPSDSHLSHSSPLISKITKSPTFILTPMLFCSMFHRSTKLLVHLERILCTCIYSWDVWDHVLPQLSHRYRISYQLSNKLLLNHRLSWFHQKKAATIVVILFSIIPIYHPPVYDTDLPHDNA